MLLTNKNHTQVPQNEPKTHNDSITSNKTYAQASGHNTSI